MSLEEFTPMYLCDLMELSISADASGAFVECSENGATIRKFDAQAGAYRYYRLATGEDSGTKYEITVKIEKKDADDSKEYDDDEIIGQSLAKGSEVKKGDTLILYTPKNDTTFPDFAKEGYSKDDVAAFCEKYGLNCTYNPQETTTVSEGKIISQSRLVGSTVSKGSNLTVDYAIKPKKTTPSPSPTISTDDKTEEDTGSGE